MVNVTGIETRRETVYKCTLINIEQEIEHSNRIYRRNVRAFALFEFLSTYG